MKRNSILGIITLGLIILMGACNDNAWDELPKPMMEFITKYFPQGEVATYVTDAAGNHIATIRNGSTITFNDDYVWVDVNGNGSVLPEMFIYDELPTPLYRYLQEMEQTDAVYRVQRTADTIRVELLNTYITYDETNGSISYPQ